MKRMALFTIGLCILSVGFIASGVEPEDQQATTIRQLRAEVQMLRATVASLQVEVAKLKADLKQQSASPDKVAVPSTQPTTAPVPGTENDRVIKANLKYGRILDSANATQAQKQAAYISYYKETVGISVTIIEFRKSNVRKTPIHAA